MNRRTMLNGLGLTATAAFVTNHLVQRCRPLFRRRKHSHVAVLKCPSYDKAGAVICGVIRPSLVGPRLEYQAIEFWFGACCVAPTVTQLFAVPGLPTVPPPDPALPAANTMR